MSPGLAVTVFFITGAGVVVGCWAFYRQGRLNGYLKGYADARKAARSDAEAKINAIRREAEAAQTAIDYLYDRSQLEVEQFGLKPASADGGADQP